MIYCNQVIEEQVECGVLEMNLQKTIQEVNGFRKVFGRELQQARDLRKGCTNFTMVWIQQKKCAVTAGPRKSPKAPKLGETAGSSFILLMAKIWRSPVDR